MQRAFIYVRVSTAEQLTNLSLETQRRLCVEYCERNGITVDRIFTEEGESAKTAERTQLKSMIDAVAKSKGRISYVVVYRLDRFARKHEDHTAIRAILKKHGATLRSVSEAIDDTSSGQHIENIIA